MTSPMSEIARGGTTRHECSRPLTYDAINPRVAHTSIAFAEQFRSRDKPRVACVASASTRVTYVAVASARVTYVAVASARVTYVAVASTRVTYVAVASARVTSHRWLRGSCRLLASATSTAGLPGIYSLGVGPFFVVIRTLSAPLLVITSFVPGAAFVAIVYPIGQILTAR